MVDKIHYRWDFIGLSTDSKPTPAESPKVVDGSTFYESNTSKLYVFYKDTWYEKTGSGGGTSYTAGDGIDITGNTISVDTTDIQEKLTAGSNITISGDNEISATDTTYSNFTGTDGTSAGTAGLVPAPATTDAGKFLKADGTWDTAGGGSGPTVVQSTGDSTTDVMSQKAVTDMIFYDNNTTRVKIGNDAQVSGTYPTVAIGASSKATKSGSTALGYGAKATGTDTIAIGNSAEASQNYSIAIGAILNTSGATYSVGIAGSPWSDHCVAIKGNPRGRGSVTIGEGSVATSQGEFNIGSNDSTNYGYNNSNYRLLTGLYDGQSAHDAVTVEQVNATIDAINTALSTSIPHIGA